jgi:NAD+ synthase
MFSPSVLNLDAPSEIDRIAGAIRDQVLRQLHRRGAVVGISGGIDSSVVAALCARALGQDKVLGLLMPERHSSGESLRLGRMVTESLGIEAIVEDITPVLEGAGCYRRQQEAIATLVPGYGPDWQCKLVMPSLLAAGRMNVMRIAVRAPNGETTMVRPSAQAYLKLVAATNFKQRARKMMEYHHADRLGYAVAGTPNRLEYDQGFFVKQGDGAADFKPIAHLYKTQVYALARCLGIPAEVLSRPPTTDTYSLPQTQEEFYFALPYDRMDLCLYAKNHGVAAHEVAAALSLTVEQVERVFKDIEAKRQVAHYLRSGPLLLEEV